MTRVADTVPALAGGTAVRDRFLVFGAPLIGEAEIEEVVDTLRSGWIGFGPKCLRLEQDFARYVGASHAISLSSCTAGLHLALAVTGVGQGDEVITTPLTFAATANVIEHVGARVVFADVDPATQNLDAEAVAASTTSRTKAVIPVHLGGRPCDMGAITKVAVECGLTVIEDAAHAVEAVSQGQKIGSISKFTSFSFYATKNLTTGEGGMVTTNDGDTAARMRVLRQHGISRDAWQRHSGRGNIDYDVTAPGYKYNLTDLQASLGLHQLARLEDSLDRRERYWRYYDANFADLKELVETPVADRPGERHGRHLYTMLLKPDRLKIDRDRFVTALQAENIGVGVHFAPVHLHSYYRRKYGFSLGMFPYAEEIGQRTVSIPMSAALSASDVDDVVEAVRKVLIHFAR